MFKLLVVLSAFVAQLSYSQQVNAQQGSAKAYVALSPAGDFVGNMKATGSATVSGAKVSAQKIVVDMKSLTTGLDLRDDHAKNKYMEVSKYPEAVITDATGENGKGTGKLKFHGKENPVSGTYKIVGKTLQAEFKIKMSEYGISDISYKGIGVDDDVRIEVTVPIVAAAATPAAAAGAPGAKTSVPPAKPLKK